VSAPGSGWPAGSGWRTFDSNVGRLRAAQRGQNASISTLSASGDDDFNLRTEIFRTKPAPARHFALKSTVHRGSLVGGKELWDCTAWVVAECSHGSQTDRVMFEKTAAESQQRASPPLPIMMPRSCAVRSSMHHCYRMRRGRAARRMNLGLPGDYVEKTQPPSTVDCNFVKRCVRF